MSVFILIISYEINKGKCKACLKKTFSLVLSFLLLSLSYSNNKSIFCNKIYYLILAIVKVLYVGILL